MLFSKNPIRYYTYTILRSYSIRDLVWSTKFWEDIIRCCWDILIKYFELSLFQAIGGGILAKCRPTTFLVSGLHSPNPNTQYFLDNNNNQA